jgi:hypothetical protein
MLRFLNKIMVILALISPPGAFYIYYRLRRKLIHDCVNFVTHANGEHSMLIDINGDGLPDRVFDRNPKTDQTGLFVYLNSKPSPGLR